MPSGRHNVISHRFPDYLRVESGKYNVTIKGSKGVQVGDGNLQVNKW